MLLRLFAQSVNAAVLLLLWSINGLGSVHKQRLFDFVYFPFWGKIGS
jgi:hypothetical protein